MTTWATVPEVAEITGVTVTDAQLNQANGTVELHVGRLADAVGIGTRDLAWLKRAVAYQAAWEKGQADLLTRSEVKSSSQDGASSSQDGEDQVLGPLAKRALRHLSWRGNRSVGTTSTLGRRPGLRGFLGSYGMVEIHDWPWDKWGSA